MLFRSVAAHQLHIPAGPIRRRHGLYLTTMVQIIRIILLSGGGVARHRPHLQHYVFIVQKSVVIPLIALLQQVLPRNYSSARGAMGKHLLEGQGHYELEVSSLILKSIREFEARIITQDPVPLPDKQTAWVTECWTNACAKLEEKYELPDRIIGLVSY